MAIREGAWNCPACGRTANRGSHKHCAGCGYPRGEEVEFYLPEDAPEVTSEADKARALAGPDWTCTYCEGDNAADHDYCTGCGASRDGAPPREVTDLPGGRRPPKPPARPPSPAPPPSAAEKKALRRAAEKKKKRGKGCWAIGCLGLLLVAALIAWCSTSSETEVTVSGFSWLRTIEIERLETHVEEGRAGRLPEGARLLDDPSRASPGKSTRTVTERVQVGTERVKVGVRDLGNGFFEDIYEDRPIYERVEREVPIREDEREVRYEIDRWEKARQASASGQNRTPYWPETALRPRERAGERSASYRLHCTKPDGETLIYRTSDEAEWRRYRLGERYLAEVTRGGRIRSLTPR